MLKARNVLTLALAAAAGLAGEAWASISSDITNLTGGRRTKIVWSREVGAVNHPFGGGTYRLMAFDTAEGAERDVLGTTGNYFRAKINHDGSKIYYNSGSQLRVVNWNGTGDALVSNDMALGTIWYDSGANKEYAFVAVGSGCMDSNTNADLYKVDLSNPSSRTLVWTGQLEAMWLSVSLDGAKLGGSFPWSSCGVIPSTGGTYLQSPDGGCWSSISPQSGSYRFAVFDGAHRNWMVWDFNGSSYSNKRVVVLNNAPGINGWEVYHPRWAMNDPGFVTMTGPYDQGGMGGNNIYGGGPNVEIYFGKFDAGVTQVTNWVKVTSNTSADFYAQAWIDTGGTPGVSIDSFTADATTIVQGQSTTLRWETSNATSVRIDQGIGTVAADGSRSVSPGSTTTYTLTAEGTGGPVTRQVTITVVSLRDPDGAAATASGLDVRYYELSSPGALPNFGSLTAYKSDVVANIDYASTNGNFATSDRADNVGAVFTGCVEVGSDGIYTFYTESDDGSALYIGATKVVDNDGLHGMQERSGQIGLKAGKHTLRVEFFEAGGGAGVIARYEGPGLAKQTIPAGALWRVPSTNVSIESFTATPSSIQPGQSCRLAWDTTNATSVSIDQGIGAVSADGYRDVQPQATTTYTLTAQGPGGPVTRQVTVTVTGGGSLHLKINCGSNDYDVEGWERDDGYVTGGEDFTFGATADVSGVANAAPVQVYKSCRHRDYTNTWHRYDFPTLPNGTYIVRFHFYDQYGTGRAMDYYIEGALVLDDYSIAPVGKAVVLDFPVTVSDSNGLQIVADIASGNDAFECGLEIIATTGSNSAPAVNAGPDATIQMGESAFLDGTVTDDGLPSGTLTCQWTKVSGPGGVSFGNASSPDTTATFSKAGTYVLRLTASDGALSSYDEVTVTVTEVTGPSITLIAPNGGEVWYVGTTRYVRWESFNLPHASIYYSTDGGVTLSAIAFSVDSTSPYWLNYPWQIPNQPSTQCLVKISGYFGEAPTQSASMFEIRAMTDSDQDGMDDNWERSAFGDLSHNGSADSDGDGLTDKREFDAGTSPVNPDTDGDGMTDAEEVAAGTNPIRDDAALDYDRDGHSNIEEVRAGSDPRDASSVPASGGGGGFSCSPAGAGRALGGLGLLLAAAACMGLARLRERYFDAIQEREMDTNEGRRSR